MKRYKGLSCLYSIDISVIFIMYQAAAVSRAAIGRKSNDRPKSQHNHTIFMDRVENLERPCTMAAGGGGRCGPV
jgi:hypothetical protein